MSSKSKSRRQRKREREEKQRKRYLARRSPRSFPPRTTQDEIQRAMQEEALRTLVQARHPMCPGCDVDLGVRIGSLAGDEFTRAGYVCERCTRGGNAVQEWPDPEGRTVDEMIRTLIARCLLAGWQYESANITAEQMADLAGGMSDRVSTVGVPFTEEMFAEGFAPPIVREALRVLRENGKTFKPTPNGVLYVARDRKGSNPIPWDVWVTVAADADVVGAVICGDGWWLESRDPTRYTARADWTFHEPPGYISDEDPSDPEEQRAELATKRSKAAWLPGRVVGVDHANGTITIERAPRDP